ncbi:MAG: hypothetical protein WBF67_02025, partial [Olleya sp.]
NKMYKWNEKPKLIILNIDNINDSILKQNKSFVKNAYNDCNEDVMSSISLKNISFKKIKNKWKESLKPECDSIKLKNGDIIHLKLFQVSTDSIFYKIYRYKVNFTNLNTVSEIRLLSTLDDKYYGLYVIDKWYDEYYYFKEAVKKAKEDLN